jgi:small subunit ribosomal protein S17
MRSRRKVRTGRVISDKMDKTVVVEVKKAFRHPVYKKVVRKIKKYYVHDEENKCKVGDLVSIMETRPISKTKRWRIYRIIKQK